MHDAPHAFYRRSAHLVFYWSRGHLVVDNYATRTRAGAQPIVCEILHFFHDWRSDRELFAAKPNLDRKMLRQLLSLLVQRSMLHRRSRPESKSERAMASWSDWNPAAGFFHNTTKDLEYADLAAIERITREKSRLISMPPSTKRHAGRSSRLPPIQAAGEFVDVLMARRTWRRFGKEPITGEAFGTLLALTGGVQSWIAASNRQKVALKTSPSGGARHSIELYALALRVRGVAPGIYHYAADRHALELIRRRTESRLVQRYLPTQWWFEPAAALIFFAAVFAREQWRYTHPRAYRAVLIEAGHLCQTFCLTATWLGLAPFCSMALADSQIETDLKVDGIRESVLYAAGVGSRPDGLTWKPEWTAGREPPLLTRRTGRNFPGRLPPAR